jgi:hypothetical protein
VRPRYVRTPALGRTAVWTAAISAAAVEPHAALAAFGIATCKEVFDLLRARSDRISIMAFMRTSRAGSYLRIDSPGVAPGMILQTAALPAGQSDDAEEARDVPGDDEVIADSVMDRFFVEHRADWVAYARSLTSNWVDIDDAVQRALFKSL